MSQVNSLHTFCIEVFGCQMNVYDGDRLRSALVARGLREVGVETADAVIYVTCSIRDKAEQKVASDIGRFARRWKAEKKPAVALVGCMAQRTGESIASKFPWVRVIAGPRHLGAVPDAVMSMFASDAQRMMLDDDPRAVDDLLVAPTERTNPYKAYLTIAHGCDHFCTYCIVPHVRGRFASRASSEILKELALLAQSGVVEVTLLGQNVNSYATDFSDGYTFAKLLRDAAAIDGLQRIRFTTSHPVDFTDDIIEAIAREPKICAGINLPVQSGSDRVLREMNRGYTIAQYADTVRRMRAALPELGLTTDMIVGFPGETREDFERSLDLLRDIRFDIVHSAAYSPREGTPAAVRTDQVDEDEKFRRLNALNDLQSSIAREINEALVGKRFEILVDAPAPRGGGLLQGRTATDKVVIVKGGDEIMGRFVDVRIVSATAWSLEGEVL